MTSYLPNSGVGLRPTHYPYLEEHQPQGVRWFEAISENYMDSQGRPRDKLLGVRRDYPLSLHGVSMSLLSPSGLNPQYLKKLKALVDQTEPFLVSDHLCWTGMPGKNLHDLLPFPFTTECLEVAARNIDQAQTVLGRPMVIENASSYMQFRGSEMTEWDFLLELTQRTGAKILLDINNVYVSAMNHGYDPYTYLNAIPPERVGQIHLAGHTDLGDFLFDTHSAPVNTSVWEMFSHYIKQAPEIPFMIEWDEEIPEFPVLEEQIAQASAIWEEHHGNG